MHVTDGFTTPLRAAGAEPPADREIDGVDQLEWLTGAAAHSRRDGCIYWMGAEIYGVKWRDFKLVLVEQQRSTDAPQHLASPHQPPHRPARARAAHPAGAPLDHVPVRPSR